MTEEENNTIKNEETVITTTDEKTNQQPDRFFTPQPGKPNGGKNKTLQDMDYQPTPPPATVTVQKTGTVSSDPCWVGCLLACFICCLVKDEPRS